MNYPSYPNRAPRSPIVLLTVIVTAYILFMVGITHEVQVAKDHDEFVRLDAEVALAQDLVNALDVLRQPPVWQSRTWSSPEVEARYAQAVLRADSILKQATALEHSTAYPCTIKTLYRECFR